MNELLTQYTQALKTHGNLDEAYKWEAINHFQQHWNIETENFEVMFLEAFRKKGNLMYQNSWGFIRNAVSHFPEKVRAIFRNLYDENLPLADRINTFQAGANQILPEFKMALGKENFKIR